MTKNKAFIESVIQRRNNRQDPVQEFAIRNKASPIKVWCKFEPYSEESFKTVFKSNIDGVKLKFKNVTLTINGRHKSK